MRVLTLAVFLVGCEGGTMVVSEVADTASPPASDPGVTIVQNGSPARVIKGDCSGRVITPLCDIRGGGGMFIIGDTCGSALGATNMTPPEVELFCGGLPVESPELPTDFAPSTHPVEAINPVPGQ